jgi:predicted RecA/RadA family phage recombinase
MTAPFATLYQGEDEAIDWLADADHVSGDVIQLKDGRAAVISVDVKSGFKVGVYVEGIFKMTKTATMVLLDGGKAYWDYSANAVYYRKTDDHDFLLGRVVGDATSASTTCYVQLNVHPPYDIDYFRDPGITVLAGTAAAGAFGRGLAWKGPGCMNLLLSATSEAQKVDWLSKDGFDITANPIIEFAFSVPTGSAAGGAQDLNIGIATGTHATDADSITKHLFMHFDGNQLKIYFQSKDGTTTVAATDSTKVLVAGNTNGSTIRTEIWMDCRNPASCLMYVNAVAVLTATIFDISAWSTTTAYLLAHLEKTTGTDTAEVDVDWLRARFARV